MRPEGNTVGGREGGREGEMGMLGMITWLNTLRGDEKGGRKGGEGRGADNNKFTLVPGG